METVFGYQQRNYSTAGHWAGLAGFMLLMLGMSWAVFHRAEQDA
jgi:ABC-2 type transport system permease protein